MNTSRTDGHCHDNYHLSVQRTPAHEIQTTAVTDKATSELAVALQLVGVCWQRRRLSPDRSTS